MYNAMWNTKRKGCQALTTLQFHALLYIPITIQTNCLETPTPYWIPFKIMGWNHFWRSMKSLQSTWPMPEYFKTISLRRGQKKEIIIYVLNLLILLQIYITALCLWNQDKVVIFCLDDFFEITLLWKGALYFVLYVIVKLCLQRYLSSNSLALP